ncbi:YggS family pyridoxal phosphate-dependent enzyme [Maribius pontilimi]|uniref:Pyridoxal phosphate homeostasis protein n=1 Tax=Palleronia pontilimi TaxID=1964209 RepID=A0A934MD75_9RHOB|nr:YggS family pyridoxal phosphate-dependent enzyme [Palleronia pontilimi]MBJ3763245.1 YggS family pyridoxal phosphate-dependent enzyme [Palleronia pontilimi]
MSLADIKSRIAEAEARAGRAPGSVRLIAVSKVQSEARVEAVLEQGHKSFGENRVQEAEGKWPAFAKRYDDLDLHLIGPLQSNKTRAAMELFGTIQTVDRPKIAKTIARIAQETGSCPDLFIQVDIGDEDQKSGIAVKDTDGFVQQCRDLDLPLLGLMCIPPVDDDPAPHFRRLAELAERNGLDRLSMGMSGDFEVAIAEGATDVRVGSAIFGPRDYG